jgi:transcriptional regulator with XRE-family HTH domain
MKELMNFLKFYRLSKGFTMEEVAKYSGISPAKYGQIEKGEQTASDDAAKKISTLLEVPKEQIFLPTKFTVREILNEGEFTK